MAEVIVFGADWCGDCIRAKRLLDERNVDYTWRDIVAQPELADQVVKYNIEAGFGPKRRIPIILIDGKILSEPSNEDLLSALNLSE